MKKNRVSIESEEEGGHNGVKRRNAAARVPITGAGPASTSR